jgi:hypothetical protein
MALLPVNVIPIDGKRIDNLFVAATSGGDTAPTGQGVLLLVKNTSGSAVTVTIPVAGKIDGDLTPPSRTFTVAATSGEHAIALRDAYRDPATGLASIAYSSATSVTVAVVRAPLN